MRTSRTERPSSSSCTGPACSRISGATPGAGFASRLRRTRWSTMLLLDLAGERTALVVDEHRQRHGARLGHVLDVAHDGVPVVGRDRRERAEIAVDDALGGLHPLGLDDLDPAGDRAAANGERQRDLAPVHFDGRDERDAFARDGGPEHRDALALAQGDGVERAVAAVRRSRTRGAPSFRGAGRRGASYTRFRHTGARA